MRRHRSVMTAAALAAIVATWAHAGRAQQGVGERVGEKLDQAGRAIKRGAKDLGGAVGEAFDRTRASVHSMSIQSRVYGRLHWDKALSNATFEVQAAPDGTVTLRGTVLDAAAREKAVALARDTVGVGRV